MRINIKKRNLSEGGAVVSGSNHQFSLLRIFFKMNGINLNLGRYKKEAFKSFFRRRNLLDIIKTQTNSSKEYIYIYIRMVDGRKQVIT